MRFGLNALKHLCRRHPAAGRDPYQASQTLRMVGIDPALRRGDGSPSLRAIGEAIHISRSGLLRRFTPRNDNSRSSSRVVAHNKSGFTLIELSIVLVIIGLIVGGVLVGQDLIKAAEIRSQITQIEKINVATNTFKLKYNGLPADLGSSQAAAFGLTNQSFSTQERFNNGFIDAPSGNQLESDYFLLHLKEANLIECTGCNRAGFDFTNATLDAVFTAAKIGNNSILQVYGGARPSIGLFGGEQSYSKNYFEISQSALASIGVSAMSPSQAFQIDSKVDDGLPLTGKIIPVNSPRQNGVGDYWNGNRAASTGAAGASVCVSTSSTPNVYNTTNNEMLCNLRFEAQF